jgi:flagellar motor switch protein FliG
LKTATEELKDKIFRNMSERASLMMKEDMESMGPVKLSDVEGAQMEIINIVRKLEEQGKVVVGGKGGEDLIV